MARDRHPDRVAIEGPGRLITYAELSALAIDGVRALQAMGVRAGAPVALQIEDRMELAVALHACLLAGTAAMPIDPRLTAEERAAKVGRDRHGPARRAVPRRRAV